MTDTVDHSVDITESTVIGQVNLYKIIDQALELLGQDANQNTDDLTRALQQKALMTVLKKKLDMVASIMVQTAYSQMTDHKMEIPGLGIVKRSSGTEWDPNGWDDETITERIVDKVISEAPDPGEDEGTTQEWVRDLVLKAIDETVHCRGKTSWKATELTQHLIFNDLQAVGERRNKQPTVTITPVKQ